MAADTQFYFALARSISKERVDLHGKSADEATKIIDRLAVKGGVWEVVTGHGKGVLKKLIRELQKVYHFTILSVAPNDAAFVIDFS
jgi:DNA-nicking Smr family endonuclease